MLTLDSDELYKLQLNEWESKLHPLIHTLPPRTSAPDVEKKKAEPKTPHFLSLNQDIVAWSQKRKCGLRDVIHISGGAVWT